MVLEKENAVLGNRELMGPLTRMMQKKELSEKNMAFLLIKTLYMDLTVLKTQKLK
jgi:hypothetical protein